MGMVMEFWRRRTPLNLFLSPLSGAFCLAAALRRRAYRRGWLRVHSLPVPVIVVGNITVGGSGKTPLVAWMARRLREEGYRPGIVSRGYGGQGRGVREVTPASDPFDVGDEPVLLARHTGCPVVVGRRRAEAAHRLLELHPCDVIIADDGLQHYALSREIEIAVMDGDYRLGNGLCLPAGPLREPKRRLEEVDRVIVLGEDMTLVPAPLENLASGQRRPLATFRGQKVHAVAGIAHPGRFFRFLERAGLKVHGHPFPDHHRFTPEDIDFDDGLPVLMTEKDGVKCEKFARERHWVLPVEAQVDEVLANALVGLLKGKRNGQKVA
ncbi:MAG: tetraacyldisaccharide 4'-kinase [Gammaproteobacteria bacterium]|nr:MAG: tetraacyldisaccharide 4'-kinase [Gammaproteobacteria bacterium]